MQKKQFLTTAELAKLLGLHRATVYQKIKSGKIKATRVGRNFIIDKKDMGEILGKKLSKKEKLEVEKAVKKTVAEYRETLKLLGTT